MPKKNNNSLIGADKNNDFLIGADPEFMCVEGREIVIADDEIDNAYSSRTKFGADGCGDTFEIRPSPSKCPIILVKNIRNIILKKIYDSKYFLNYDWKAGSYYNGYSLGGHIHFGIKRIIKEKLGLHDTSIGDNIQINNYYNGITCILSQYLLPTYVLLEKPNHFLNRRRNYGQFNDYRIQKHGIEYRALGSWLISPYITTAILCLAKIVMWEILNNEEFKREFDNTNYQKFITLNYYSIISRDNLDNFKEDIKILKKTYPKIWNDIENMELFNKFENEIKILNELIMDNRTWYQKDNENNFIYNWGVNFNLKPKEQESREEDIG